MPKTNVKFEYLRNQSGDFTIVIRGVNIYTIVQENLSEEVAREKTESFNSLLYQVNFRG